MKKKSMMMLMMVLPLLLLGQEYVSLDSCRNMALENNHKLLSSEVSLIKSGFVTSRLKTNKLPKLSFDGLYAHLGDPFKMETEEAMLPVFENGQMLPYPQNFTLLPASELEIGGADMYHLGLNLSQAVYAGGRVRNAVKVAELGESIAHEQMELQRQEVILKTDQAYWRLLALKEKQKLAQTYLTMLDDLVDDLDNYLSEGLIIRNDLLKAKVKRNEADLALFTVNNAYKLSQMVLCQQIGKKIDTDINVADTLIDDPALKENLELDINEALEMRPENNILQNACDASKLMTKITMGEYLPEFGVGASYYYQNPDHMAQDNAEFSWAATASLSFPVFHWFEMKHAVNEKKQQERILDLQYQESMEMMTLELNQKYFQLKESMQRLSLTKKSLEQAKENLRVSEDNFREGMITTTELLEAQSLWQKAYSDYIDAKTSNKVIETEFEKAKGQL